MNVGPNHLSHLDLVKVGGSFDSQLPDDDLFKIEAVSDNLKGITLFLEIGNLLDDYTTTQKKHMVVHATDYQLIAG